MQPAWANLVEHLELQPHPEGGFYRETYRADERVTGLPARFGGARSLSTAILFLLPHGHISALHRIKSDEVWHFYQGASLRVVSIAPDGRRQDHRLGTAIAAGEVCQAVVSAGHWFGAHVDASDGWSLVGCTVAPGFEFSDLELGQRAALLELYPQHREIVEHLTRA